MTTHTFIAQDAAGTRCTIKVIRNEETQGASLGAGAVYQLEDGTPVQRVDNDTFKVIGTGAYISLVREHQ